MRLLLIHSNDFEWKANKKALENIEELKIEEFQTEESILVAFCAAEKQDENVASKIVNKTIEAIKKVAKDIKETNIIIYPFVHLTENPCSPRVAKSILRDIYVNFSKLDEYKVFSAPFGYYKSFILSNKGHPLAERSQIVTVSSKSSSVEGIADDDYSQKEDLTAVQAEEETKTYFRILTKKGEIFDTTKYRYTKAEKNLKKFVKYEINKDRTAPSPPPHIELMKKLELTDYEPGTDPGNFRFPSRGFVVKESIQERVKQLLIDFGAHVVTTPVFYDFEHPALKKYLNRFPARQYVIESGNKNFFMRFSACFGQFLTLSQSTISYRNLPVYIFENAGSYRREQSGEISGLRRLRGFTMPDVHSLCSDIPMAKQAFQAEYELSVKMMNDLELDYEVGFRCQEDFFEEHKAWIIEMIKLSGKNCLIELFKERYAYFILKFEFNFVDTQNKAAALSTVQIDVENGERFDIKYFDEEGKHVHVPYILHCSISGSIERVMYAMLEKASMQIKKSLTPALPFWLSPVHVRILPVGEKHLDFSVNLMKLLKKKNIRVEVDDRLSERVGKRIRASEKLWTPYTLVIGDKEISGENLAIRTRGGDDLNLSVDDFIAEIESKLRDFPRLSIAHPSMISKQVIFSREV